MSVGDVLTGRTNWCVVCDDAIAALSKIPDGAIHTVVTSPPYWGLRDYGTATWKGGDRNCRHLQMVGGRGTNVPQTKNPSVTYPVAAHRGGFPDACRCGARRVDRGVGLEATPDAYVERLVEIFREVRRVLRDDGTVWLNLGDSYAANRTYQVPNTNGVEGHTYSKGAKVPAGLKPKDLVGTPWRVAFALQADGWFLRSDIIWAKPNPMPESVTDRPTKAHEYLFLLTKCARYSYDADAIREPFASGISDLRKMIEGRERIGGLVKKQADPFLRASALTNIGRKRSVGDAAAAEVTLAARRKTAVDPHARGRRQAPEPGEPNAFHCLGRNKRTVWTIATEPFPGAHFATFPKALVTPCIQAGTSERGCCPTCGAPWKREVSVSYRKNRPSAGNDRRSRGQDRFCRANGSSGFRGNNLLRETVTTAWLPACSHDDLPIPCLVLDPFCGSGTTGVVANRLGRRFIGIDLKAEYVSIARERIAQGVRKPSNQKASRHRQVKAVGANNQVARANFRGSEKVR